MSGGEAVSRALMQIGEYAVVKCEKPTAALSRVRQMQTDAGPADFFADINSELLYMRAWLNRDGLNEIVWYRLEKEQA